MDLSAKLMFEFCSIKLILQFCTPVLQFCTPCLSYKVCIDPGLLTDHRKGHTHTRDIRETTSHVRDNTQEAAPGLCYFKVSQTVS
jgi:hypothetical protein